MGLTIHWKFRFEGNKEEAKSILLSIREKLADWPLAELSPLWELDYSKDFNDDEENKSKAGDGLNDYRWAKIQYQPPDICRKGKDGMRTWSRSNIYPKYKGWVFMAWAGEGCEPTNIGLISHSGKLWRGHAFTKTQYAEDFVKCHLLVIKILDLCKIAGIVKSVHDEGDYWETRDLTKLAKNINDSTAFISQISCILSQKFPGQIMSPIDNCKNILNVENNPKKEEDGKNENKERIEKNL